MFWKQIYLTFPFAPSIYHNSHKDRQVVTLKLTPTDNKGMPMNLTSISFTLRNEFAAPGKSPGWIIIKHTMLLCTTYTTVVYYSRNFHMHIWWHMVNLIMFIHKHTQGAAAVWSDTFIGLSTWQIPRNNYLCLWDNRFNNETMYYFFIGYILSLGLF